MTKTAHDTSNDDCQYDNVHHPDFGKRCVCQPSPGPYGAVNRDPFWDQPRPPRTPTNGWDAVQTIAFFTAAVAVVYILKVY